MCSSRCCPPGSSQSRRRFGKLPLPCRIDEFFSELIRDLRAQVMGLDLKYVARLAGLPAHHADPFDRLIIAQALVDDCEIITSDGRFGSYGVNVVW